MDNDLAEGRLLRKNKRNTICQGSNAVRLLEGFSVDAPSNVDATNAEDITDMEANSASLNQSIRKMQHADKNMSSVAANLGEIQQYGNKNIRGTAQIQQVPGYVTNAGIMKMFVDKQAFEDTKGQNNCPSDVDKLTAQGSPANGYGLFPVGSAMVTGQSCGNEGEFAQVTTFDDSVSSPDDIADSLGQLGYIDADATLRPINREDYTMEDQFTTNTSSMQGSSMMPCDSDYTPLQDLGCWKDESDRAMWIGGEVAPMRTLGSSTGVASIEKCGSYCTDNGASIFAVQDGKQCFCAPYSAEPPDGEGYKTYGASDACTVPCMGFEEETCGGVWANQVYKNDPEPPACDIDVLQNTCTSDDDCIGFVVDPSSKTYQMFNTDLKGTDLTTSDTSDKTFYTRKARFISSDETCTDDVVNRRIPVHQFENYPVSTVLDPSGSSQCGLGQYLQADLTNMHTTTADANTQANNIISANVDLASTMDNVQSQSWLDSIAASQNLTDFATSTSGTIDATKALQNIAWNQEVEETEIRKRQNLFQAIGWGGLAIAVLGVAVAVSRKTDK